MKTQFKKISLAVALMLSTSVYATGVIDPVKQEAQQVTKQSAAELTVESQVSQLSYTAQNVNASTEERVAALHELAQYPSQNSLVAVARGLRAEQAEIRIAAIAAAAPYQFEYRWRMVSPLLTDEKEAVRNAAALNLAKELSKVEASEEALLIAPLEEVKSSLIRQSTAENKLLLANVHRWLGEWDKAEKYYADLAEKPENSTVEIWLNFADNYRAQGNEQQALSMLDKGISLFPEEANLYYSKALTLVRLDRKQDAAVVMNKAAEQAENNSYFWYLNGVLQEPLNIELSVSSFEQAYLMSGSPEQLYALCDIYIKSGNDKAEPCLEELGTIASEYVVKELKEKRAYIQD